MSTKVYHFTFILFFLLLGTLSAGVLQGIVSDQEGQSITGARVLACGYDATGDSIFYETMSGFEGEFMVSNMKVGTYYLSCTHSGYLPYRSNTFIVDEETSISMNVTLVRHIVDCVNSVSGHVYSVPPLLPAFIPLADADVFLVSDIWFYHARSNQDGLYEFKNVQPGTYYLSAEAFRHIPQSNIDTIEVVDGTDISDEDIYLVPVDPAEMVKLSGHVWSAGITDQNFPQPVYPACITLTPGRIYILDGESTGIVAPDTVYPLIRVINNPDGSYEIPDIPKGNYNVSCEARGYEPQYIFLLDLNTKDVIQDFFLKPLPADTLVTLSGHVWEDEMWMQQPVYPARIVLSSCNSSGDSLFYYTYNNPDGSYKINNIIPGKYTARCMARGYHTQVIHELELKAPTAYQDFYLTPVTTPPDGWITGQVYFDENNLPVMSAYIAFYAIDGTGLPVIPNDSSITPGRPVPYGVYTDSTGSYIASLPQGKYYVSCTYYYPWDCFTADCIGYGIYREFYDNAHTLADATPVAVLSGQTTADIDFGIPLWVPIPTVTVTGRVTDDQNNPLEKALVRIWELNTWFMAAVSNHDLHTGYTDENGYYKIEFALDHYGIENSFGPLPVNGFIVSAEKSGYQIEFYKEKTTPYLADRLFAFEDTVFSDIDFTLEPCLGSNSISGVITNESGQVLSDVFVIGSRINTGEIVFTFTDSFGRYTLGNLKEDYYYLLFALPRYIPEFYDNVYIWQDATAVLAAGLVTGIDASLTHIGREYNWGLMTGLVKDEYGSPLDGAIVTIKNEQGEVLNYDISGNGGGYEVQGLPTGRNQICVSKVNYTSTTTWFDFDAGDFEVLLMNFTLTWNPSEIPDNPAGEVPTRIELMANYPNPFNPETHIQFGLPAAQKVSLKVYDILGRQIVQILDANMSAGMHTVTWDGTDHAGHSVSSGIYFYALQGDGFRLVKKMILNR